MLEVSIEGVTRLDSLGRRLRVATEKKMIELTGVLYEKVQENLSGKVLQKRSGELSGSIRQVNEVHDDFYVGSVFPSPATDKAWALEKGGKGYYEIVATKAQMLKFVTKSGETLFRKRVNHPPSKEFGYLRLALAETEETVPQGFRDYIQTVLDGGDYG